MNKGADVREGAEATGGGIVSVLGLFACNFGAVSLAFTSIPFASPFFIAASPFLSIPSFFVIGMTAPFTFFSVPISILAAPFFIALTSPFLDHTYRVGRERGLRWRKEASWYYMYTKEAAMCEGLCTYVGWRRLEKVSLKA
jgi:hypothetical protein